MRGTKVARGWTGVVAGSILGACFALDAAPAAPRAHAWPDTPAGRVARQWVAAFSTGEEAMREFLKRNLGQPSLARKGLVRRVESYRKLRERYGSLALAAVVKQTPHELTVALLASDGSTHRFVFTVDEDPPHRLVSVGIVQRLGHGHGGGSFHP